MEIIKHTLTTRNDFMSLLSTAPPPFRPEIEAKLKGLKSGTMSTVPGTASCSTQVSAAPVAPATAPQQVVSTLIPPATVVPPAPPPTESVVKSPAPISTSQPAPVRTNPIPQRKPSNNGWKWLFAIGVLAAGVYIIRKYQKKKAEEKK